MLIRSSAGRAPRDVAECASAAPLLEVGRPGLRIRHLRPAQQQGAADQRRHALASARSRRRATRPAPTRSLFRSIPAASTPSLATARSDFVKDSINLAAFRSILTIAGGEIGLVRPVLMRRPHGIDRRSAGRQRPSATGLWLTDHLGGSAVDVFAATKMNQSYVRTPWIGVLVVCGWAGMAGCNGTTDSLPVLKVYEVKGKVLKADGRPLSSGSVYLVPKGDLTVTPNAVITTDGTFSVVTGGSGEGAPPGEYKVRIETPEAHAASKSQRPVVPFKYTDEDSSGLVVTVRPEANHLEPFQLK